MTELDPNAILAAVANDLKNRETENPETVSSAPEVTTQSQEQIEEPPASTEVQDEPQEYDFEFLNKSPFGSEEPSAQPETPKVEKEPIETDPFIEWAYQAKSEGKDVLSLLREMATNDPNKLTARELLDVELNRYVKENQMTEEEAQLERDAFESKTKLEQIKSTESVKERLIKEHQRQMEFLKPAPQPNHDERRQRVESEKNQIFEQLKGSEYNGMEFTEGRITVLKTYVDTEMPFVVHRQNANNQLEIDVKETIEFAAYKKFKKEMFQASIQKAKVSTKLDMLKERTNPSPSDMATRINSGQKNGLDEALDSMKNKGGYYTPNKN